MAGEDCRVANAPRNDKNASFHNNDKFASFHNNDKFASFRSNDRVVCRGCNPLLCHCERSAAIYNSLGHKSSQSLLQASKLFVTTA